MNLSDTPHGPACPSRASGWWHGTTVGVSRVVFVLLRRHAVATTPAGPSQGWVAPLIKRRRRPSPYGGWVGSRIYRFEAFSAFTYVTACLLAGSLNDPLHRRLRQFRYLHYRSDCYRLEQQLPGGNCTH
jgi:hypothetical protein